MRRLLAGRRKSSAGGGAIKISHERSKRVGGSKEKKKLLEFGGCKSESERPRVGLTWPKFRSFFATSSSELQSERHTNSLALALQAAQNLLRPRPNSTRLAAEEFRAILAHFLGGGGAKGKQQSTNNNCRSNCSEPERRAQQLAAAAP